MLNNTLLRNISASLIIYLVTVTTYATPPPPNSAETRLAEQAQLTKENKWDIQFMQLAETIWQYQLQTQPMFATSTGDTRYNHLLPDLSKTMLEEKAAREQQFLAQLAKLDVTKLSKDNQLNHAIIYRQIKNAVDEHKFKAHYMPLTAEGGFHSELAFLPRMVRFQSLQDYQDYLARLQQIASYFSQNIMWMKQGIAEGITQPAAVLQGFEDSIKAYISNTPEKSIFFAPFNDMDKLAIDAKQAESLKQQAVEVITNQINPAFEQYYQFFTTQYLPASRKHIAATQLPNGHAFYQNRVAYYTTLSMTAYEIHQLGLKEVKRIRAEMEKIIELVEFEGDFADFIAFLRSDSQFYAQSADELLKQASYIAKKMDAKLPSLFKKLPRTPYGIAPVPDEIAPKYTTGRYVQPQSETQPGYYWVNTYALERRPLYVLEALTFHEAVPGHHLQIALNMEMHNVPPYRQHSYISAFGEGWGLYAEWLGVEAGFYQDPYSQFGRLTYEMWRACRLVVDTGMHSQHWSRQQAIDYLQSNTALSAHNVRTEIDRYISWPAQALSYKLGELTIKRLRALAEEKLGNAFDVREFHDVILSEGSIPLSALEKQVEQYIATELNQQHEKLKR
ncbi:DUF885 domain-containing protein [Flocculibacter collagenilyticus]|uniref:DUF885 domain-containing protein n=1 Tax=Flocculibacter collagenilyticus TaxID=2744479 RepID=UPI001F2E35DC|nr:DUF885 domain-containing protein [Flocculibacter collagenilyticus]